MERDSVAYKARRKFQALAKKILPNAFLSKIYFRIVLNKKLNLENPRTFNEKLQWMKLYYYPFEKNVVQGADKYAVREYIQEKGYGEILVPLIGSWTKADEILWEALPNQFVLKCNHGCAYNLVCSDKEKFDVPKAKKQLKAWLREDFGAFNVELHYSKIKDKRIICEEFLGENLTDYKFFCFNGKPHCMYVSTDLIHDRQAHVGFFDLQGNKLPLKRDDYTDIAEIKLPTFFDEMKEIAENLSKDFPFVRVDFFVTENRYYFAELTFTPGACMMPFNPPEYDLKFGDMLNIDDLLKKGRNS